VYERTESIRCSFCLLYTHHVSPLLPSVERRLSIGRARTVATKRGSGNRCGKAKPLCRIPFPFDAPLNFQDAGVTPFRTALPPIRADSRRAIRRYFHLALVSRSSRICRLRFANLPDDNLQRVDRRVGFRAADRQNIKTTFKLFTTRERERERDE